MKLQEFFDILNESKYTTIDGQYPHKHQYTIDKTGNGETTITSGDGPEHIHKIEIWDVKPTSEDGHGHSIRHS